MTNRVFKNKIKKALEESNQLLTKDHKISAEIVDKDGLWLVVNGLPGSKEGDEGAAWPITEEEIPAILDACKFYLIDKVIGNIQKAIK